MASLEQLYPGLYSWVTTLTMESGMTFPVQSLYVIEGSDRVLVDPALPEGGYEAFETYGKPTAIVMTSDSHDRDVGKIMNHYNIPVYIHESMAGKVEGIPAPRAFKDGETLPGNLKAVDLPGLEETAFILSHGGGLLVLGDAVLDMGQGPQPLPAQWVRNPAGYASDLSKLTTLNYSAVWLSHGGLIQEGAKEKVKTAWEAQEAQVAKV